MARFLGILSLLAACSTPVDPSQVAGELGPLNAILGAEAFVKVNGGTFTMGSRIDPKEPEETPHLVRVGPFWMMKTEVTQETWQAVMGKNPSTFALSDQHPVETVSHEDVRAFVAKINKMATCDDCQYRLPTEAEWEFAARAGSDDPYFFGTNVGQFANFAHFADGTADDEIPTQPVAQRKPNAYGLFDLYGNVWEWCQDVYEPDYYKHSPKDNPLGPMPEETDEDTEYVLRGGSCEEPADRCRSAVRASLPAWFASQTVGFRLVRVVSVKKQR